MKCIKCGSDNDKGTNYCTECGAPLFKICDKCGTKVLINAKFCAECGSLFPVLDLKIERYKRHLKFYDYLEIRKSYYGKYLVAKENGKYFILDINTLQQLSERKYDYLDLYLPESREYLFAKYKGKWGVINPINDKIFIDFKYDDVKDDSYNGTIRLKTNNKWGRVKAESGKVIFPFIYDEIEYDSRVKYNGYWGALDDLGKEIVPFDFLKLSPYRPCENIWPSLHKNGKWGVINIINGDVIIEFDYDEIKYTEPFGTSVYYLRKGDKWGMYSQRGKRYACIYSKEDALHLSW